MFYDSKRDGPETETVLLSTYFTFEKLFTGAGETVELLRACTLLMKDSDLIPSTHVGTLTTA